MKEETDVLEERRSSWKKRGVVVSLFGLVWVWVWVLFGLIWVWFGLVWVWFGFGLGLGWVWFGFGLGWVLLVWFGFGLGWVWFGDVLKAGKRIYR